jgi:hypothetical protein
MSEKLSLSDKLGIAAVAIAILPIWGMILFMFVVWPWLTVIKWVLG